MSGWAAILGCGARGKQGFNHARWAASRAAQSRCCCSDILQTTPAADFGRHMASRAIDSFESFARAFRSETYDDLRPWLDRVIAGEPPVLTTRAGHRLRGDRRQPPPAASSSLIRRRACGLSRRRSALARATWRSGGRRPSRAGPMSAISPVARQPRSIGGGIPDRAARPRAPISAPTLLQPSASCWPCRHRSPRSSAMSTNGALPRLHICSPQRT